ncbi:MAG: hypothetical protein LKG11_00560 [Bacilli bacterium]|jgi:uncharacterized membrane protein (DUF485 family)|nr:hypothetical protein [Bacilli bacterium]
MKIKLLAASFSVSLLNGVLAYLVTWSLPIGIGVGVLFLVVLSLLLAPMIEGHFVKERKRRECYRFVNGFFITLSVSKAPERAFEAGLSGASPSLSALASSVEKDPIEERIDCLKSYFGEPYFATFANLFKIYEEQGGDPLTIGKGLLEEATRIEKEAEAKKKEGLGCLAEFLSLWLMSGLIILFVRICLRSYRDVLMANPLYLSLTVLYFAIALVSFLLFGAIFTGEPLFAKRKRHA